MATERFYPSAHASLNSITEEISAMNTLIIANVTLLPNQPELIDQLIRRCNEMLLELHSMKSSNALRSGDTSGNREPSAAAEGIQA